MATLIGDYGATHSSGFHTMIATSGLPYSSHSESPHYRSASNSRDAPSRQHPSSQPRSSSNYCAQSKQEWESTTGAPAEKDAESGASRFPSPPDSSSPSGSVGGTSRSDDNLHVQTQPLQHGKRQEHMESTTRGPAQDTSATMPTNSTTVSTNASTQTIIHTAAASQPTSRLVNPAKSIPSPSSDSERLWTPSLPPPDDLMASADSQQEQTTVHIRNLAHIQELAYDGTISGNDSPLQTMKYEIAAMPIHDIIDMVAALLTKITTTNDRQHDALSRNAVERNASHVRQAQAQNDGSVSEHNISPMSSSVLAFHGKNVPAITILSYLSRIHKYCPTTYEVFLSLLVYFDRMTERVNDIVMKAEEAKKEGREPASEQRADVVMHDDAEDSSDSDESDEDLADDDDEEVETPAKDRTGNVPAKGDSAQEATESGSAPALASTSAAAASQPTFFVVDSFNIHRLIIAGVTCASKYFSDVFYTNSRYAKVGGLPLPELNHLELQYLLLNDFRLAVAVEDLEAYATMLVEFYAREVIPPLPATDTH